MPPIQYTNNMRDLFMSMFMLNDEPNNMNRTLGLVYRIAAVAAVERLITYTPMALGYIGNFISTQIKNRSKKHIEKIGLQRKSSIQYHTNIPSDDKICDAITDYTTNLPNIKSVCYRSKTYLVSNKDPVCIDSSNQIYVQLLEDNVSSKDVKESVSQILEIYSYEIDIYELRKFVDSVVSDYTLKLQNKLGDRTYYFNALPSVSYRNIDGRIDYSKSLPVINFTMKPFVTNRRFNNVIGPESKIIQKRVDFFKNNKKWYDSKGIPYTLGLLLSGPPGGGKTSTIKCVANELRRHIINVKLSDDITKTQIENLFFNEVINVVQNGKTESFIIPIDKRVYVFEDIDCHNSTVVLERIPTADTDLTMISRAFIDTNNKNKEKEQDKQNKKDKEKEDSEHAADKMSLSCLLNVFDGILETPGRVIIMTSNFPGKLDKALIRPGRIDVICEFRKCNHDMIIEFIEKFYDVELTRDEIDAIFTLPIETYTPAELTKLLFENFDNHKTAIAQLLTAIPMLPETHN